MQRVIERELLEHRPYDQKDPQKNEHDPCERVLDDVHQVVPGDDRRFVADQPQPLQAGHDRKQHKKGKQSEIHLKCDHISKVFLHQSKGLHYRIKPLFCSTDKAIHPADTSPAHRYIFCFSYSYYTAICIIL